MLLFLSKGGFILSLVERIQALCSSKDTTLIGLEREIGLGRGTIRKWDQYSPSVDKIQKVADYFNVFADYLLGNTEIKNLAEASRILLKNGVIPVSSLNNELKLTTNIKDLPEEHQKSLVRLANSYKSSEEFDELIKESDRLSINNEFQDVLMETQDLIYSQKDVSKLDLNLLKALNEHIRKGTPISINVNNEGEFNIFTKPEVEELQLITRFRKLTPASQTTVTTLVENLEIVDAQLTKEPEKEA
jgi:transcriptional regulator with XRE-family HTH domain